MQFSATNEMTVRNVISTATVFSLAEEEGMNIVASALQNRFALVTAIRGWWRNPVAASPRFVRVGAEGPDKHVSGSAGFD